MNILDKLKELFDLIVLLLDKIAALLEKITEQLADFLIGVFKTILLLAIDMIKLILSYF